MGHFHHLLHLILKRILRRKGREFFVFSLLILLLLESKKNINIFFLPLINVIFTFICLFLALLWTLVVNWVLNRGLYYFLEFLRLYVIYGQIIVIFLVSFLFFAFSRRAVTFPGALVGSFLFLILNLYKLYIYHVTIEIQIILVFFIFSILILLIVVVFDLLHYSKEVLVILFIYLRELLDMLKYLKIDSGQKKKNSRKKPKNIYLIIFPS